MTKLNKFEIRDKIIFLKEKIKNGNLHDARFSANELPKPHKTHFLNIIFKKNIRKGDFGEAKETARMFGTKISCGQTWDALENAVKKYDTKNVINAAKYLSYLDR